MAVRTIIVGCGLRGRDWLREVARNDDFELVGAVDPDGSTLEAFRLESRLEPSSCFAGLAPALERTDPGAVIVASPEQHHVDVVRQSLDRSLGVLVEKPFTMRYREARELVELADRQRVPLVVAQNFRYLRVNRAIRKVVRDGTVGEVGVLIAQYYRPPHEMPPSVHDLGERIMWRLSVHHFDAMRWTLECEFTRVCAEFFKAPWTNVDAGDSFHVLAEMEGDIRVTYQATYESTGHEFFERGQEFYERIVGSRGTLHVFHRWLVFMPIGGGLPRIIGRGPRPRTEESILLDQVRRGLDGDMDYESSGRDNLGTMAALEAMSVSARERRWVELSEVVDA